MPIITQKQPPIKKKRDRLSDEQVADINFFHEDLVALDDEVEKSDELYGEIHKLYSDLTGGEYIPNKNLRDIAELAKSMISTRSYHADVLNKRIALKKLIADVNYRNNGGIDEAGSEAIQATARQIVSMVRQEAIGGNDTVKKVPKKVKEQETNKLEETIKQHLENGSIVMGKNDKLVGTNDYVVTRYDKKNEKFVAVDSRDGSIIPDFPEERLPSGKINKSSSESVTLMNGDEIKLYEELEFDDEYLDEGD